MLKIKDNVDLKELDTLMDKNFLISQIRNCVAIICFTILALTFKHWWITFFSILFFIKYDNNK